jgi:trans-aconitate 2-methyltransferase
MPTWDTEQYLRFSRERTQPAVDLAARIAIASPRRVIDLGCGPGNSTEVLARRWPEAELTGMDQSLAMVSAARTSYPTIAFSVGDIATWTASKPFDVIFSNAALQWLADHARTLPRLLDQVAQGGAFAFQVPANLAAPGHQLLRDLGASGKWQRHLATPVREWHVEPPEFYYETLATHASRLDIWVTEYIHVLPGPHAIVDWYRGTGARPWLDALPDDAMRSDFLADYGREITRAFPAQSDGNVLFPFRRLFVIAYR